MLLLLQQNLLFSAVSTAVLAEGWIVYLRRRRGR